MDFFPYQERFFRRSFFSKNTENTENAENAENAENTGNSVNTENLNLDSAPKPHSQGPQPIFVDILFRCCSRGSNDRFIPVSKKDLLLGCFQSILESAEMAQNQLPHLNIRITVLDDHSDSSTVESLLELMDLSPVQSKLLSLLQTGNGESLRTQFYYARSYCPELIYLLEDDYLHTPEALSEMFSDWFLFSKNFGKDVVLYPCDYIDRYYPDQIEPSRVVLGSRRHWRLIYRTTGTLFLSRTILLTFWDIFLKFSFYGINHEINEDSTLNRIYRTYLCFSPIPSLSAHVGKSGLESPYFDHLKYWSSIASKLQKLWPLFGKEPLLDFHKQPKKNLPPLSVVGTGYVGLITALGFALKGFNVLCVEKDPVKLNMLKSRKAPFFEPGLQEALDQVYHLMEWTHSLTVALERTSIIFLAIGTPLNDNFEVDLNSLEQVIKEIQLYAPKQSSSFSNEKTIVIKSTIPIGTTQKWQSDFESKKLNHITFIHNPEFLREGSAIKDVLEPERIVLGFPNFPQLGSGFKSNKGSGSSSDFENSHLAQIRSLYDPWTLRKLNPVPLLEMDSNSSELLKYASNSFLGIKISFINEISLLSEKVQANIQSIKTGLGLDSRINPLFLQAGVGFGGSCLPKDLQALWLKGKEHEIEMKLVSASLQVNRRQKNVLLNAIKSRYLNPRKQKLTIWGLSYKPQTDDLREAPSLFLIKELISIGFHLSVWDPKALGSAVKLFNNKASIDFGTHPYEVLQDSDGLLLLTEWEIFHTPNWQEVYRLMNQKIIFDGRNLWNPQSLQEKGFEYYGFGQGLPLSSLSLPLKPDYELAPEFHL